MIKPLHIDLDAKSPIPIYEQVKFGIKVAIFSGDLAEGDRLTSIRDLSLQLKINPNTIIKAYSQLEDEGFIISRQGAGYYVKLDSARVHKEKYGVLIELTAEYVHRALGLGYAADDILNLIQHKYRSRRPPGDEKESPHDSY